MIGTCQDITERQRAEAALQRYAHRLECLRAIDLAILSSRSPREIAEAALANLTRHGRLLDREASACSTSIARKSR